MACVTGDDLACVPAEGAILLERLFRVDADSAVSRFPQLKMVLPVLCDSLPILKGVTTVLISADVACVAEIANAIIIVGLNCV